MASPFSKYQGGIAAPQNAAEIMSQPGQILANYINKGFDAIGKGIEKRYDRQDAEKERQVKLAEVQRQRQKDEQDRRFKGFELSTKLTEIEIESNDKDKQATKEELESLNNQLAILPKMYPNMTRGDIANSPEYKSLIERIGQLNDTYRQQTDKSSLLLQQRKSSLAAYERELAGLPPPPKAGDVAAGLLAGVNRFTGGGLSHGVNAAANYLPKMASMGAALGGVSRMPDSAFPKGYEDKRSVNPEELRQLESALYGGNPPSDGTDEQNQTESPTVFNSAVYTPPEEAPLEEPPEVSSAKAAYRGGHNNVEFNPGVTTKPFVIGFSGGNARVSLGPSFAMNAESDDAIRLAGGYNTLKGLSPSQETELSTSLNPEGVKEADRRYKALVDGGYIEPSQLSMRQARAAFAAQAYSEGKTNLLDSDSVTRLGGTFGQVVKATQIPNQNTAANVPVPGAFTSSSIKAPISTYIPGPSANIPLPQMEEGVILTSKSGMRLATLFNQVTEEQNQSKRWAYEQQVKAQERATQVAIESQKANAAATEAQVKASELQSKEEREAASYVAQSAASMPGLTPGSTNRANGFFRYSVGDEARNVFDEIVRRSAAQDGRRSPGNIDYARGFMGISHVGINHELAQKDIKGSRETWEAFGKGFLASSILSKELESQVRSSQGAFDDVLTRIKTQFNPGSASAANYRMFLLGAFRKSTVGLGNPSNFEQELLLSLIPDPKAFFDIKTSALARSRMLMFYQASTLVREMQMHNMEITSDTETELTKMFHSAGILSGNQRITKAAMEDLNSLLGDINTDPRTQVDRIMNWVSKYKYDTGVESQFQALRAELRNNWATMGSEQHMRARENLLDEINREPNPQIRARLIETLSEAYR